MQYSEKLGEFYLGKTVDLSTQKLTDGLFRYDSKDLTTHAVTVGMTGSGKTGLALALIEEAGLDKIPAILIDPKGDLGDLLLTFPDLSADAFLPWIDKGEAERNGQDPRAYAETVAKKWRDGLKEWGEGPERVKKLRESVELNIYTPASRAGLSLSILSSFAAPPKELLLDPEALRDRVMSTASSLLGLLGIDADPIKSREHIFLSSLLDQAWAKGEDLDIPKIIQQVQTPPFSKVGVLDIDTFFPQKERQAFSIRLNNLLASPGFQAWMEGEPLNISTLLSTKEGKPKLSILSIAHLSDAERMFFVTLFLNEYISWMRRQPGTSSLRTLLYMDEVFGFFPPIASPPSKKPMLTLLKQARAFGVGIVLATQNPADLDYKGLANCGTWFIGKLQTDRDKSHVLEGLKVASNGQIDIESLNKMVASTGNRTFIMRSIHQKEPVLFQTRWTLSYLKGPLTLVEIASLMKNRGQTVQKQAPINIETSSKGTPPTGVLEYYVIDRDKTGGIHYNPFVLGKGKLHFVDPKNRIDCWLELLLLFPCSEEGVDWEKGAPVEKTDLQKGAPPSGTFEKLPYPLTLAKNYPLFSKAMGTALFQNQTLTLYKAQDLTSNLGESLASFKTRAKDALSKQLKLSYEKRISMIRDKMGKAEEKASEKEDKANRETTNTLLSFGTTLLGVFLGKGVTKGTLNQAGSAFKKMGKVSKGSEEASKAADHYKSYQEQLNELQQQLEKEIGSLEDPKIELVLIRPRKSDIFIEQVALAWKSI